MQIEKLLEPKSAWLLALTESGAREGIDAQSLANTDGVHMRKMKKSDRGLRITLDDADLPRLMSIADGAFQLGITERHVLRMIASGQLAHVKIGRRKLLKTTSVLAVANGAAETEPA